MDERRLAGIDATMEAQVASGSLSGAVTAIALKGEIVHFGTYGWRDVEEKDPMPADAIFRMASSTKPVIGVAVMQQIEQGRIDPDDQVSKFLPTFKDTKVVVAKGDTVDPMKAGGTVELGAGFAAGAGREPGAEKPALDVDLVPADRPLLVRDLLTHTSGLMSGGLGARVSGLRRERGDTLATYIPKLGDVPLDFQPGSMWRYSAGTGIDVLGHLVELVSDQPLDEYLQANIFDPLGMVDTGFALSEDKRSRLLPLYRQTGDGGLVKADASTANRMSSPTYFSGSGGLMGTASDYLAFERMLTNGGTFNGAQVMKPETVALMATNHVGDLFQGLRIPAAGLGFGFTVQVVLDAEAAKSARSTGAFGWGGAFGTMTWSDPARGLSGVYMVQQPDLRVRARFERAVRAAVDEYEGVTPAS